MGREISEVQYDLDAQIGVDAKRVLSDVRMTILNLAKDRPPIDSRWKALRSNPLTSPYISDDGVDEVSLRERIEACINVEKARDWQREGVLDLDTIRAILLNEVDVTSLVQSDELLNCRPWSRRHTGCDTWGELEPKIHAGLEELLNHGKIELALGKLPVDLKSRTVGRLARGITALTKLRRR